MLLSGSRVRTGVIATCMPHRRVHLRDDRPCLATSWLHRGVHTRIQPLPVETADFILKRGTPREVAIRHGLRAAIENPKAHVPSALLHIVAILAPFLALPLAGWIGRRPSSSLWLAAVPAALTGYFAYMFSVVSRNGPFSVTATWAPALNLVPVVQVRWSQYAVRDAHRRRRHVDRHLCRGYLERHPHAGRFHVVLFAFMGSMLGVVLSDNLLALFVFWELTGFHVIPADRVRARAAGGPPRGAPGSAGDRRRRPGAAGGRAAAGRAGGDSAACPRW